jgi:micrococcal nuclease
MTRGELGIAAIVLMISATGARGQVVDRVKSGDTLVLRGVGTVRLAGIRSADEPVFRLGHGGVPEPRHDDGTPPSPAVSGRISLSPDRSSRAFLRKLVLGKTVRMELDRLAEEGQPSAYVFLQDGTLVNAEMLRKGRARIDSSNRFERQEEFRRLEAEARSVGVGIWAGSASPR